MIYLHEMSGIGRVGEWVPGAERKRAWRVTADCVRGDGKILKL